MCGCSPLAPQSAARGETRPRVLGRIRRTAPIRKRGLLPVFTVSDGAGESRRACRRERPRGHGWGSDVAAIMLTNQHAGCSSGVSWNRRPCPPPVLTSMRRRPTSTRFRRPGAPGILGVDAMHINSATRRSRNLIGSAVLGAFPVVLSAAAAPVRAAFPCCFNDAKAPASGWSRTMQAPPGAKAVRPHVCFHGQMGMFVAHSCVHASVMAGQWFCRRRKSPCLSPTTPGPLKDI